MEEIVSLQLDEKKHGHFYIPGPEQPLGEMQVGISGNLLTVYHTEVSPHAEGKGYGKKLFAAMVDYARQHQLKVKALCPFTHAQFKRHPAEYSDIWTEPTTDD